MFREFMDPLPCLCVFFFEMRIEKENLHILCLSTNEKEMRKRSEKTPHMKLFQKRVSNIVKRV